MAIIIETCPKCGHDLRNETVCTYPPIPRRVCYECGWVWEGAPEQVLKVPFCDDSVHYTDLVIHGNTDYECVKSTDCCMANNLTGYAFTINQDDLDKISTINHDRIAEAVERTKMYIKEEQL